MAVRSTACARHHMQFTELDRWLHEWKTSILDDGRKKIICKHQQVWWISSMHVLREHRCMRTRIEDSLGCLAAIIESLYPSDRKRWSSSPATLPTRMNHTARGKRPKTRWYPPHAANKVLSWLFLGYLSVRLLTDWTDFCLTETFDRPRTPQAGRCLDTT